MHKSAGIDRWIAPILLIIYSFEGLPAAREVRETALPL